MPKLTINYTQDIDTVYRFVTDPDVIKKRSEELGEKNVRIQVDEAGGTKTITSTRDVDSDLPGFAKRLFSSTNTIVERREWRDAGDKKTCKSHIDVLKTPGTIDSNVTISPNGSGCTYDIEFEVSAKVPTHPQEARRVRRQDHHGRHARRARLQPEHTQRCWLSVNRCRSPAPGSPCLPRSCICLRRCYPRGWDRPEPCAGLNRHRREATGGLRRHWGHRSPQNA